MEMKQTITILLVLALLAIPVQAAQPPSVTANSAVLYDPETGEVLWAHNADARALIASTTKIMTAFLVVQVCPLEQMVCVPREAVGVEGSSMYLKAGERIRVRELLLGLMLASGNDAAVALAVHTAGSVENFVKLMNWEAERLHLENTCYANPHGLDAENNYSTARELAQLTASALQNPAFADLVRTKQATAAGRMLTNHNKLLWRYEGCIGVKTGFTKAAGRILVSAAQRDGRRLIVVTIGDANDWHDHAALLDYGFSGA